MTNSTGLGVVIIGATSAIAMETAKLYAAEGTRLFLAARDAAKLVHVAQDLKVRGAGSVDTLALDLTDGSRHQELCDAATAALGRLDIVLVAHGILGNQAAAEADYEKGKEIFDVNFLSVVSLLTPISAVMEKQHSGTIAVISSVAGDRGRQSNYYYGSAKAAKSTFLSGLRNRMFKHGVRVLTIKPGFVDTPMTAEFPKGPLFVGPDVIARGIHRAIAKQKNVVYLPFFWWAIMAIIKAIPEPIFERLKL